MTDAMKHTTGNTPAPKTHVAGLIKRYDEHPDGGGMREDELGAYVRFETVEQLSDRIAKLEDVLRNFTASRDISYIEALKIARVELGDYRAHPSPSTNVGVADLTNDQKEITLLRIIDAMGGRTDSSDYPGNWLTWFCSDEIHNVQEDTFNRCNEKGWLNTTHDTSFDTSTTTLTAAGRAALATSAGQP